MLHKWLAEQYGDGVESKIEKTLNKRVELDQVAFAILTAETSTA